MEKQKKINRKATIQNILKLCNESNGISIDIDKFNEKISGPDGEEFLRESAEFCGAEIIYK
jgi:hypothetical protein